MHEDVYAPPSAAQPAASRGMSGRWESSDPWVRLAVSLGCVAIARATLHVVLPIDELQRLTELRGSQNLSVGALGITPFISAAILVELYSLLRRSSRKSRVSGLESRVWDRAGFRLGCFFTVIHAVGVAYLLDGYVAWRSPILYEFEVSFPLVIGALVAGSAVHLVAARCIERWGVGNGFAWLLLCGFVSELLQRGEGLYAAAHPLWPQLCVAAGLVMVLTIVLARVPLWERGQPSSEPARHTRAGAADSLPMLRMFPCGDIMGMGLALGAALNLGPRHTGVLDLLLVWPVGLLMAAAYHPARRVAGLRRALRLDGAEASQIKRLRLGYALLSIALVCVLVLATQSYPEVGWWLLLLPMTCVTIDLVLEFRAVQAGLRTRIWWFQRVYAADAAVEVLAKQQIPAFIRGVHFRCLSHTFGSFLPMALFVSASHAERAFKILTAAADAEEVM